MPADPKDRSDPHRALARLGALSDGLRSARLLLGLLVVIALASIVGAARTAAVDSLYLHIGGWFVGQCLVIVGACLGLAALRRRRFGARPSTRLRRPSDALLYVAATMGGTLALLGFVPAILAGTAAGTDLAIAALGAVLLIAGLRAAILHVLRV